MSSALCIQVVDMLDGEAVLVQLSDGSTVKISLDQILSLEGERTGSPTSDPDSEAPFSDETGV